MATGIAAADDAEIFAFIDSDSQARCDADGKPVQYFGDPTVGAVAGHTDVANGTTNVLTRVQAMQYYIAFGIYKSADALFGSVTCCSGYRRDAVVPVVHAWLNQSFLGQPSTFGDDRNLPGPTRNPGVWNQVILHTRHDGVDCGWLANHPTVLHASPRRA